GVSGRARAAGRTGRRAWRRGDGEGFQRVQGRRCRRRPARCRPFGDALMIYWLYQHFGGHEAYVPGWNLLRYITFRTVMSLFTAQVVVMAMGSRFIRWMQAKQGKGQPIRTDGIERHV